MIVKMNGSFWFDTNDTPIALAENEMVVFKWGNKKLRRIAVTLWTLSGSLFAKAAAAATNNGTSFYEAMQPLYDTFQDMALGIGGLAILAGLILLIVKRRWGVVTIKTTAIVVGGVFLVPSALMLLAIIGSMLNDSLWQAFNNIREAKEVMGK